MGIDLRRVQFTHIFWITQFDVNVYYFHIFIEIILLSFAVIKMYVTCLSTVMFILLKKFERFRQFMASISIVCRFDIWQQDDTVRTISNWERVKRFMKADGHL